MASQPSTGLFMSRSRVSSGIVMLTQLWSVWFLILQQAYLLAEAGSQEQEKHEKPLGAKALKCTRVILPYSSGQGSQSPAQSWGNDSTFSWEGFGSVQFSSVAQSCPTLCDPTNRSTPGLPVHHQLPEFTQTHVHRVSDAIQPSHPLSSPSPPAPNPSQHQSLFQ